MTNNEHEVQRRYDPGPNPWHWPGGKLGDDKDHPAGWYWSDEAGQLGDGVAYATKEAAEAELAAYGAWLTGGSTL
jgi:hypothetical protein